MAPFGNLEPVVLGERSRFVISRKLCKGGLTLFVVNIRDPLKKEQWENVGLEIGSVYRPTKDVGGFPKVRFEFRNSHGLCCALWFSSASPSTTA